MHFGSSPSHLCYAARHDKEWCSPPLLWFLSLWDDQPIKPPFHGLHVLWSLAAPSYPLMHYMWSPSCCCVCARKNGEEWFPPTNEMVFVFVFSLLAWFLVLLCRKERQGMLAPTIINLHLLPFKWVVNTPSSPPLDFCSFSPSCVLVMLPFLLLLCLCKEERRRMSKNIAPATHHCWVSFLKMKIKHKTWR